MDLDKILKKGSRYFVFLFVVFLGCCLVVIMQPNRFQKWNSIKSLDSYQGSRVLSDENKLNLASFIGNLTYITPSEYVYSVYPKRKYEKTILEGYGDCSTKSFGAAYYLLNENISFEIIHFFPPDTLFSGGGHVALRVPYHYGGESRVGILDLVGGGLVSVNGDFADIEDLGAENASADLHRINEKASDFYENYYKKDYLNKIYFGFTPGREVEKYFNFIEMFYFSLGNEKLEKMAYDGLAILFGQYYSIYVEDEFLDLFRLEIYFFNLVLYFLRAFLALTVIFSFFGIVFLFGKKRSL